MMVMIHGIQCRTRLGGDPQGGWQAMKEPLTVSAARLRRHGRCVGGDGRGRGRGGDAADTVDASIVERRPAELVGGIDLAPVRDQHLRGFGAVGDGACSREPGATSDCKPLRHCKEHGAGGRGLQNIRRCAPSSPSEPSS